MSTSVDTNIETTSVAPYNPMPIYHIYYSIIYVFERISEDFEAYIEAPTKDDAITELVKRYDCDNYGAQKDFSGSIRIKIDHKKPIKEIQRPFELHFEV